MRKLLVLILALACLAVIVVANGSAFSGQQEIPKESKTQPKEVVLDKDSQSDKYGEVPFNHENHATKTYSVDGKSVLACVECHHTDQAGDDSATIPSVTYPGKTAPTKLTNEVAYHMNCNICHDKAIAARPALKGKVPGSNDCLPCHKPVS